MTVSRSVAVACLMMLAAVSSDAQPEVQNILMLQSLNRGNITLDSFTGHFRVELDLRAGKPMNVIQVAVGPTGFVGASEDAVVDYIRSMFANRPPDLIVTGAGTAAVFARKHRQQLFPDVPLLLAAIDQVYIENTPLAENETAVAVVNNFPLIIDDIVQLLPETRQVFIVTGSGELGRFWHRQLEEDLKRFEGRLTFIWSDHLSLSEILRRCSSLPKGSAIFYVLFGTDASGAAYADEQVLANIHATANAPLFASHSATLGYGIVGGRLHSLETLARNTADVAVRLLNGTPPAAVRLPPQSAGRPMFDWRELRRWGIAESRLPENSVVLFRGPSLWSEYRVAIVSGIAALIIQSLLVLGLFYQLRARRRAEIESRRNLALAADVSRRQTMSALSSSMAHEIGQPLNSMIFNANALQMMIGAGRATPDTIVEILSDIRAQGLNASQIIDRHRTMLRSRNVEKKSIDLHSVINETLTLLGYEIRERAIEIALDLGATPCVINADPVLLQQVLVNLVMNAIEAMAGNPRIRRRITIGTQVRDGRVEISVRDSGPGVAANVLGTLFNPFVTTKPNGLGIGLTIARTIVDAHRGTIEVRNHIEGGAIFTLALPCSPADRTTSKVNVA